MLRSLFLPMAIVYMLFVALILTKAIFAVNQVVKIPFAQLWEMVIFTGICIVLGFLLKYPLATKVWSLSFVFLIVIIYLVDRQKRKILSAFR